MVLVQPLNHIIQELCRTTAWVLIKYPSELISNHLRYQECSPWWVFALENRRSILCRAWSKIPGMWSIGDG
jgi:hypothetical protein